MNEVWHLKDHAIARVILPQFAVHARGHPQWCQADLIGSHQIRSNRPGAVKVLPLRYVELGMTQPVAYRALVSAGGAQDMRHGVLLRNSAAAAPNDDNDLALVGELLRLARAHNWFAVGRERGVCTDKNAWILRQLTTVLVLHVALRKVHADTEISQAAAGGAHDLHFLECIVGGISRG